MADRFVNREYGATVAGDRESRLARYAIASLVMLAVPIVAVVGLVVAGKFIKSEFLTVFHTVFAAYAAWGGAVIAFYFARENFEAASRNTERLIGATLAGRDLDSVSAREIMVPLRNMKMIRAEHPERVTLGELLAILRENRVGRVPVLRYGNHPAYVVHDTLVYRTLALEGEEAEKLKIGDLIESDKTGETWKKALAIVACASAESLAIAKARMEAVPHCRDVFVTDTGDLRGEVVGFIPDNEIREAAKG